MNLDPFDPFTIAADYTTAALGREGAALLVHASQAGWLTPSEAAMLRPFAVALAQMSGASMPTHRAA